LWNEYSRRYYAKAKERIRLKRKSPEYRSKLSDYLKGWRARNVEKRRLAMKDWQSKNEDHISTYRKDYAERRRTLYAARKEEICARKRELSKTPKYRERVNSYQRNRRATDIEFALKGRLAATIKRALSRQFVRKSARTMDLIGCTPTELRAYLESLFLPGMSFENRHLWHIDHKKALASFTLTDPVQQRIACHYTNLQPLWAKDNQRKGARP
jgi:hypothetical protein